MSAWAASPLGPLWLQSAVHLVLMGLLCTKQMFLSLLFLMIARKCYFWIASSSLMLSTSAGDGGRERGRGRGEGVRRCGDEWTASNYASEMFFDNYYTSTKASSFLPILLPYISLAVKLPISSRSPLNDPLLCRPEYLLARSSSGIYSPSGSTLIISLASRATHTSTAFSSLAIKILQALNKRGMKLFRCVIFFWLCSPDLFSGG